MGNEVASAKRALGEASRTAGALRARSATGLQVPGPCAAPRCRRWTRRLQGRELGSGRARCAAARRLNCTPQTEGHRLRDTACPLGMWRQRAKKKEKEKDSRARGTGPRWARRARPLVEMLSFVKESQNSGFSREIA